MLIAGQKVKLPPRDVIVFPRADGELIFYLIGIGSFEPFDAVCPRPEPPKIIKKGKQVDDTDDETFKSRWQLWADMRQDWLILKSLEDSANEITWETVTATEPQSWKNVTVELKEAGLTEIELGRLIAKVYEVNALSERGMEAARANFLLLTSLEQNAD